MHKQKWLSTELHFPKVTKMGSIIGHRIGYNGVGVPRGQQHILTQQKLNVTQHSVPMNKTSLLLNTLSPE